MSAESLPSSNTYTVSIVEDEAVLREELAFQLEKCGFAVKTFSNASEFYRYLATRPSTLAILDIGLEGEDGLSICQHIRSYDADLGIIFVTARSMRDDRLEGLKAGADAYLVKPIDLEELILILRRLETRIPTSPKSQPLLSLPDNGVNSWKLDERASILVTPNTTRIRLSINELQLLRFMFERLGDVCSHVELAVALGEDPQLYNKHRLEVIFSRLKERVHRQSGERLPIRSERGLGYRITPFND